ncbi:MAG: hypothetical protein VXZ96_06555 [Myxococcota bacterium]|nr:hypothetical protein [Myxococcota bacterium]
MWLCLLYSFHVFGQTHVQVQPPIFDLSISNDHSLVHDESIEAAMDFYNGRFPFVGIFTLNAVRDFRLSVNPVRFFWRLVRFHRQPVADHRLGCSEPVIDKRILSVQCDGSRIITDSSGQIRAILT